MLSPVLATVIALCGGVALFAIQPLILQLSCALVGQKVPNLLSAAGMVIAAFVASLAVGFGWSFTGGWVLAQVSPALAGLASLVVSMGVASVVYSATMRIALAKAFGVAAVTHIIGLVFAGGFTLFLRSLWAVVG